MTDDFRIEVPFATRPPRLKDLINNHVMGDVWVRDTLFGPVTDSLRIAEKFELDKNILRNGYLGGSVSMTLQSAGIYGQHFVMSSNSLVSI